MKKLIIFIAMITLMIGMTFGQEIGATKIPTTSSPTTSVGTSDSNAPKYVDLLMLTSTLPVQFVRMNLDGSGVGSLAGQMSIGASYVAMYGRGQLEADGSVANFRPFFFGGPVVSLDLITDTTTAVPTMAAGVTVGVVMGMQPMSAIIGYDVLSQKVVAGLGFKIDMLTISDFTTTVLKRWDVRP